jgi:hypothetical protein
MLIIRIHNHVLLDRYSAKLYRQHEETLMKVIYDAREKQEKNSARKGE